MDQSITVLDTFEKFLIYHCEITVGAKEMTDKPIRVLLVEDNPGDARLIREMLAEWTHPPFDLACVDRLSTGLERLAEGGIDVALLDLSLPESSGLNTFAEAHAQVPQVPIIVLTGLDDEEVAVDAVREGSQDYLVKGQIDSNLLVRAIRYAIERKQAEEALRKSEEKYRSIFNNAQVGLFRTRISDGKLLECNDRFAQIFGYDNRETCIREYVVSQHYVDPGTREQMLAKIQQAGEVRNIEARVSRRDGSIIWVRYSGYICPEEGYIEGVGIDITKEKQAVEALRESEEKYRLLVDNANDAIFVVQDSVIKFSNPRTESLTGYSSEELAKIPFVNLIHPEDRDMVLKRHGRRLIGDNLPSTYSFRIINRAGEELWVEINAVLITWEGRPGTLNFLRDITAQKRLETQLQHAQRMEAIGTLAGGIAHDFNNILSAIIGNAQLALDDLSGPSSVRYSFEQILEASYRATKLVKQILAFSRQHEHERRPVQLNSIVKETLKLLRASLPSTINIRQNIQSDAGVVFADPTQIHQVLMNLCTNAAHAMRENGGVLEVSLVNVDLDAEAVVGHPDLKPGPCLRLTVRDTGHGMDRAVMERIFDPYFTTKGKGEGTGLGLALVHGIVKSHGGAINVHSELGKGTTFHIFLPRLERDAIMEAEVLAPLPKGNERILFVDDEEVLVDVGERMLERLGYKVIASTNSIEALEIFHANPDKFDLVITDQTMPNMTGTELAKGLMRIRPDIPIILCTGFSETITAEKARAMGIREFVLKPIVIDKIAATIRNVLDG
ncbi:MAG: PAS domain S-box protein [Deltaproteobacteria bacterium]|nr:PAS domain S-box protein [Deltaproteobacteria bacterium]MBW2074717.1 PAS domain S-box protein [Deltaproteobacteria bacterium]